MSLQYKLRDWIIKEKLDWSGLSFNPNAIQLLEENPDKIDWLMLSINENAIHIIEQNLDKIDWSYLSKNKNAIHILKKYKDKINWDYLSSNPNAIKMLEENLDKINWEELSRNPNAIHLLKKYPSKINWFMISMNPNAYDIIIENLNRINLNMLCFNTNSDILEILLNTYTSYIDDAVICGNPYAFPIFTKYYQQFEHKICWNMLSMNTNAICLLEKYPTNINWERISYNSEIFEIDYLKMKSPIGEELIKYCFHPSNIDKFENWGY